MVAHIIDQKSTRNERIAKIIPEMLIRDSLHGTLIPMTQRIVSSSDVIEFRNEPWHYSERLSWGRMQARTCYLWTQACAKQGNKKCQFTLAKHFSNHFKNEDEEYKHGWERMEHTNGVWKRPFDYSTDEDANEDCGTSGCLGHVYFWNWDKGKAVWKRPVDYSTDEDANEEDCGTSGCSGQFNCSLQKAYRESKTLEWYQKAAAQGLPEALEAVAQLSSTQSLVVSPECSCTPPGPPPPPDCSCKQYNIQCSCTSRFTCHGGRTMAEQMAFQCPRRDLAAEAQDKRLIDAVEANEIGYVQKWLKKEGAANIDAINDALIAACQTSHIDIVVLLLNVVGIDVNHSDEDECTPIMFASYEGHVDVVRLLLEQPGIDINKVDVDGDSSLGLATEKGYTEIIQLLTDAGATPPP